MESGPQAPGDVLQVIGRPPPGVDGPAGMTGSIRLILSPERRRKLSGIVFATLGACGVILVAAAAVHVLRPSNDASAYAATTAPASALPAAPSTAAASAATAAAAPATQAAAAPAAQAPQTGTIHVLRPALPGKVWLDGQKVSAATATVACGSHQLKVGARGKAHAVDVPCGGDLKITH